MYLILCLAGKGFAQESWTVDSNKDTPSPGFVFRDLNGVNFRLSNYRGRTGLLNFMTTCYPECKTSISHLNQYIQSSAG